LFFKIRSQRRRVLDLSGAAKITDLGFSALLSPPPSLTALRVGSCPSLSDASLRFASAIASSLHSLDLSNNPTLTSAALKDLLEKTSALATLSLAHVPSAGDDVISTAAAAAQRLRRVILDGCPISDLG
jgi:hypothetical protein